MTKNDVAETTSDAVARRVRELRTSRGWSVSHLAGVSAKSGHPELTYDVIYNIEGGRRVNGRRRRAISIDELFAFASVFALPLASLAPELDPDDARTETWALANRLEQLAESLRGMARAD